MVPMRIVVCPAFDVAGKKTYISGPDNEQFGRFWQQCRQEGLLEVFDAIRRATGTWAGEQTHAAVMGVSRVERDPSKRDFDFWVSMEVPAGAALPEGLERYTVPAATWAVFEAQGPIPQALVAAEMYAFMEWLPASGYRHALAPEIEVYPAGKGNDFCEFWLPIEKA